MWIEINNVGPCYGYNPKPSKSWLITKPQFYDEAKELFEGLGVQISCDGIERYLGTPIGTDDFIDQCVTEKVEKWITELRDLIKLAKSEPQLAYSAYVFGLSKRWLYTMRTTPNISTQLYSLEKVIKNEFIPVLIGQPVSQELRDIFALPGRFGELGLFNPAVICDSEYNYSRSITKALAAAIKRQEVKCVRNKESEEDILDIIASETNSAKNNVRKEKHSWFKTEFDKCMDMVQEEHKKHIREAAMKGSSAWLTCLPPGGARFHTKQRRI